MCEIGMPRAMGGWGGASVRWQFITVGGYIGQHGEGGEFRRGKQVRQATKDKRPVGKQERGSDPRLGSPDTDLLRGGCSRVISWPTCSI